MTSHIKDFTIVVVFLILGISSNQGRLLAISHLREFPNSLVNHTCISENGYAALVWNCYTKSKPGWFVSDFMPPKPKPTRDFPDCAIWDSDRCSVQWVESTIEPRLVESTIEPMGPVFDYRWESFDESVNRKFGRNRFDQTVNQEWKYSGSIVISVQSSRPLLVFICEKINVKGPCFAISIGKSLRALSISMCTSITWDLPDNSKVCHFEDTVTELDGLQENTDDNEFDTEVWRTFRIDQNSDEKSIQIFEGAESRARVHNYRYILLKKENEFLSTLDFLLHSEYLCIELFVGLCSDCRLNVDLVSDAETIGVGSIDGNMNSTINKLLAWRSVRLNAIIPKRGDKRVQLELRTRLKNGNVKGRWAVDSLRWCEPAGSWRKSTIGTGSRIKQYLCQKLSYDESVAVHSYVDETPAVTLVNSTGFLDHSRGLIDMYGSSSPYLGPLWSICDPTGCTCDRGFRGLNCDRECEHGYYGYGCREECRQCANRSCANVAGYCGANCSDGKLLPPLCREGIPEDDENQKGQSLVWLSITLLIPIGVLLLVITYRVRLNSPGSLSETPENVAAESVDCDGYLVPSAALNRRNWIFPAMMNLDNGSLYQDIGFDGPPYDPRNHILEISQFKHYLEDGPASGLLKLQYEHVSDDPPKACEYGKLIPNLAKNRSRDMVAYDETRVSLEKIAGDPYSDYINANYIRGYRQTQAYIATQGPTSNTMGDFWRMVWQEKISLICMVTDLIENGEDVVPEADNHLGEIPFAGSSCTSGESENSPGPSEYRRRSGTKDAQKLTP